MERLRQDALEQMRQRHGRHLSEFELEHEMMQVGRGETGEGWRPMRVGEGSRV